jgi:hypothetical protein
MQSMNLGKIVSFAYSDGSIEYRDRVSMTEAFVDGDLDRVWHLAQIGFAYPDDEPCKICPSSLHTLILICNRLAIYLFSNVLLCCPD